MVSVFTDPKDHVDATLTYMKKNCGATMAKEVETLVADASLKKNAGDYIKLSLGLDSDQRRALRSLLLCR